MKMNCLRTVSDSYFAQ